MTLHAVVHTSAGCENREKLFILAALPNEIRDVDGCRAACAVSQCGQTSPDREWAESFAQDFSAHCIDHDIDAITFRDPANTVAKLLHRKVDHFVETKRGCLLCLRMVSRG